MIKNIFVSFHYGEDASRVRRFRSMMQGRIANKIRFNDWEAVKYDTNAIQQWINAQLGKSDCTVVLIGSQTATSDWVKYEIKRSWEMGLGLIGINVHNFKDENGHTCDKGQEPFTSAIGSAGKLIPIYDPPPTSPYSEVYSNLDHWLERCWVAGNSYANDYSILGLER